MAWKQRPERQEKEESTECKKEGNYSPIFKDTKVIPAPVSANPNEVSPRGRHYQQDASEADEADEQEQNTP